MEIDNSLKSDVFAKIASSEMNNWVGGQDAIKAGLAGASLVKSLVQVKDGDKVLDFGCGIGRVAAALSQENNKVIVHGVDIASDMIDFCNSEVSPSFPLTKFYCLDGCNPLYDGYSSVATIKMPEIDFFNGHRQYYNGVYSFSVFTHMTEEMSRHYLAQLARVLSNSGVMLVSIFLLDSVSRGLILEKRTEYSGFFKNFRGDEAVYLSDEMLELVAYGFEKFSEMLASAGLCIQAVFTGRWRGVPSMTGFPTLQDLVLVRPISKLPEGFDPLLYLKMHPDVRESNMTPQEHYLKYGFYDNRPYFPEMSNSLPSDFDAFNYVLMHEDLLELGVNGAHHYLRFGLKEGRQYAPT